MCSPRNTVPASPKDLSGPRAQPTAPTIDITTRTPASPRQPSPRQSRTAIPPALAATTIIPPWPSVDEVDEVLRIDLGVSIIEGEAIAQAMKGAGLHVQLLR